jgi:hypothetical protein
MSSVWDDDGFEGRIRFIKYSKRGVFCTKLTDKEGSREIKFSINPAEW